MKKQAIRKISFNPPFFASLAIHVVQNKKQDAFEWDSIRKRFKETHLHEGK